MEGEGLKKLKKRLAFLIQELAMKNYYDGWTVNGFKKERKEIEEKIKQIEKDNI